MEDKKLLFSPLKNKGFFYFFLFSFLPSTLVIKYLPLCSQCNDSLKNYIIFKLAFFDTVNLHISGFYSNDKGRLGITKRKKSKTWNSHAFNNVFSPCCLLEVYSASDGKDRQQ